MKNIQNKNAVIIIIVVVAILIIGLGYYFMQNRGGTACWPYCEGMSDQDREQIRKDALGAGKQATSTPVNLPATSTVVNSGWSKYSDVTIEFEYPPVLSVKKAQDTVRLSHSVPYQHSDPCDFKGGNPLLQSINDFGMSILIVDQSIKDYVQSKYFPDWDYVSTNPYTFGSLKGYKVMQGVEWCGSYEYYFEISPSETLVIYRSLVTELRGPVAYIKTYLSLPGIISPDQEEEYFNKILSSVVVKNSTGTAEQMDLPLFIQDKSYVANSSCSVTKKVIYQVPKTTAVADASLKILFSNELSVYGVYKSVSIVNGVAKVVLESDHTPAGVPISSLSSCESSHLLSVLNDTLKQYASIKSVELYSPQGQINF